MNARALLALVSKHVRNFIAPSFCCYCHRGSPMDQPLCDDCNGLIQPVLSEQLVVMPGKTMSVHAAASYHEPLKSLILAKNHGNNLAGKQLGLIMLEQLSLEHLSCDILIPIPLHWTRFAYRGFNQAEIIARVLAKKLNKPVMRLLKRTQRTVPQAPLNPLERRANVKQAFTIGNCGQQAIAGKHVILVDDLLTTGATLASAARVLMPHEPLSLTALVACRAV